MLADAVRKDERIFLAFGNLRGRNAQPDVEKRVGAPPIPRKFLPHHVTFSKSARISHHEPTTQRLLPMVWGRTTSRGLTSGMESRGLTVLARSRRLHHDMLTRCWLNSVSSAGMPKTGPSMASQKKPRVLRRPAARRHLAPAGVHRSCVPSLQARTRARPSLYYGDQSGE